MANITGAISIRPPYVELILTRKKRYESLDANKYRRPCVLYMPARFQPVTNVPGANPAVCLASCLQE